MKACIILASVVATASAFAANFGGTNTSSTPPAAGVLPATTTATTTTGVTTAATGPQAGSLFRIVKSDGATVIQQGTMSASVGAIEVINVTEGDAFLKSGGKCAFNVKFDEISATAATGTVTRLYSNDKLVAQPYNIALTPGVIKTIWTQPYLFPGLNSIRVVVNADGAVPNTKWIRVNVAGTCGATTAPPTTTTTTTTPTTTTTLTTPVPQTAVVSFKPGSTEWNNLNNVWGYSNYAVTQLKGKGYARYNELVLLNSAVTAAINAKTITQGAYNSLITGWNTFVTEAAFKAAMSTITPATATGQK